MIKNHEKVPCPRCKDVQHKGSCYLCSQQRKVSAALASAYLLLVSDSFSVGRVSVSEIWTLRTQVDGLKMPFHQFFDHGCYFKMQSPDGISLSKTKKEVF